MDPRDVVTVIAIVQGAMLAAFVMLLAAHQQWLQRKAARADRGASRIVSTLQAWLVGVGPVEALHAALRAAPRDTALEQIVLSLATRVPAERHAELLVGLRREFWVRDVLAAGLSPFWTARLRTARLLGAISEPRDDAVVLRLLRDPHPAVRVAAVPAVARARSPELLARLLDEIARQPTVVRNLMGGLLVKAGPPLRAVLERRLAEPDTRPLVLAAWLDLAVATRDPALLAIAARFSEHGDQEVRAAATRAASHWFSPEAVTRLVARLGDSSPGVRALAARGLGMLAVPEAMDPLEQALADSGWWVRFRAGLSLAQLGDAGRARLRRVADGADRYAADMARLISGLPRGVLRELAES